MSGAQFATEHERELYRAVRASHAWAYCEHMGLGSSDARCTLCAYAEYLCAKAFALADGREFDGKYQGAKRMIVWPQVRLEESSEAEAEALVVEALKHEAAARGALAKADPADPIQGPFIPDDLPYGGEK